MGLTPAAGAVHVQVFGYDESLMHSCLLGRGKFRPKEPQELAIAFFWARTDIQGANHKKALGWYQAAAKAPVLRRARAKDANV